MEREQRERWVVSDTDYSRGDEVSLPEWARDILTALAPLSDRPTAARTLGVSVKTLDRRIKDGALASVKHGNRVLVPRRAIVDLLLGGVHAP